MTNQVGKGHQGWFEEPRDDRDKMYQAPNDIQLASSVNLWTKYPKGKVEPYDQLDTQTCVANATAAALWYELKFSEKTHMGSDGPSRLFVYWNARVSELKKNDSSLPEDQGAYCRRALRSLEKNGDCPEHTWPFAESRTQEKPGNNAYEQAAECKIDVYWRLDPARPVETLTSRLMQDDGNETLLKVRQCLSEGFPVIFGFNYYWEQPPWRQHEDGTWMLPDVWADGTAKPHERPSSKFGGHAVLIIGYDDSKQVAIIQNSWGSDKKVEGAPIFYMPYKWILDYEATSDFWTIRHDLAKKN